MNTWSDVAAEFRLLVQAGVVKGAVVKLADIEQLVEDQAAILSALSTEYGKNLYLLWKLKNEPKELTY